MITPADQLSTGDVILLEPSSFEDAFNYIKSGRVSWTVHGVRNGATVLVCRNTVISLEFEEGESVVLRAHDTQPASTTREARACSASHPLGLIWKDIPGDDLRQWRKSDLSLGSMATQRDVAKWIGVSCHTWGRWERGHLPAQGTLWAPVVRLLMESEWIDYQPQGPLPWNQVEDLARRTLEEWGIHLTKVIGVGADTLAKWKHIGEVDSTFGATALLKRLQDALG